MRDGNELQSNSDHPCTALRLREQKNLLQRDGWWQSLSGLPTGHIPLIERLAAIDVTKNVDVDIGESRKIARSVHRAFETLLQPIRDAVDASTSALRRANAAKEFADRREEIEECLVNGIVPSALIGRDRRPHPVSIINAAYAFQLARLPELMTKLDGPDPWKPSDRMKWRTKVESWTMKALEDYQILSNQRR
jgi:hypothetical protein